uniref:Uncharacterized protein n=1 Tax=Arion vulgaris TaxID=1028688 RepID=A0A0B6YB27_9EUPU
MTASTYSNKYLPQGDLLLHRLFAQGYSQICQRELENDIEKIEKNNEHQNG